MKKVALILSTAAALAVSGAALAGDKENIINGCGGGNCNINSPQTINNEGGQGGKGGKGVGVGIGVGIGVGKANASVVNKNYVKNTLRNEVTNVNKNTNYNKNKATATGGNVGDITINAYDPNAAEANERAAAASARAMVDAAGQTQKYEIKNVPSVNAPDIYPTATCMGSTSGSVNVVGFGGAMGTSWIDEDCRKQEVSRAFAQMGMKEDAVSVLCSVKGAEAAPSCKQRAAAAKQAAALQQENARLREQLASREPARTSEEDKRKTDATVRAEAAPVVKTQPVSYSTGSCAAPEKTTYEGWHFDMGTCEWVAN